MNAPRCLMLGTLFCGMVTAESLAQSGSGGSSVAQTQPAKAISREAWALKSEENAVGRAREIVGLPEKAPPRFSAELTTLAEDNTPFLHDQIAGRPIWHVVITDWKLQLKSAPADEEDPYSRVFDVFIDPTDGKLLKAVSRWPDGVPPIAPEPSAQSAEEQIPRSDQERYHGFPDAPPRIDLLHALDLAQRDTVAQPLLAKQIVVHYVLRSKMGGNPRAVWAITVRGIPPLPSSHPDVPVDARNHIRTIIDADTGKCLGSSTTPQPDTAAPAVDGKPGGK